MNPSDLYLGCDSCGKWYHPECVGIKEENAENVEQFMCDNCKKEGTKKVKQRKVDKKQLNTTKDSLNKI